MRLDFQGNQIFISTGGRKNTSGAALLFIHGSGQNHLSFQLQSRFFANRGWRVFVPDMPGHGISMGAPLSDITAMARWYGKLLTHIKVDSVCVIGHSQGGLVALEMTRLYPKQIDSLVLIATALMIKVDAHLLALARNDKKAAITAMISWGHGLEGHRHVHTVPGHSHMNYGAALMKNNCKEALLADLQACTNYTKGAMAAAAVSCATLCILAQCDRMTPIYLGQEMAAAIANARTVEVAEAGHMLPSEHPFAVNTALRQFLLL